MKYPILLLLLFITPFIWAGPKGENPQQNLTSGPVEGEIVFMDGEVLLDGNPADLGTSVVSGSVLETGANSYCEVVFLGGNIFKIEADTILTLTLEQDNSSISLEQGSLGALFTKLDTLAGNMPFQIKTPTTTAGIRGTAFYIRVEDEDNTYLCACNGSVYSESTDQSVGELLEAGSHKAVRFTKSADGYTMESAALLYHDNESMDNLAEGINETINWGYY